MQNNHSRRKFLQTVGLGLGTTFAATSLPSLAKTIITQDKKKLGIALVGLGSYAKNQLAVALEKTDNCYLAGIVTGTPAKAEEWSKKYNIPQKNIYNYQNFDQIKDNKDIDIVYVVLPNSMHHEYVLRAAKAGKHVMCEKPISVTVKEGEEMVAACKKANVQLGIGYRLHFEPYNLEAKRLGQEKVYGEVRFMQTSFAFSIGDPTQWRLKKSMAGGGPLMDLGIYCTQASRYVIGEEPISVTAQFGPVTDKERFSTVEESISWQFQFPGNATVNGFTSYKTGMNQYYASAARGWFQLNGAYNYTGMKGSTRDGEMNFPAVHQQTVMLNGIIKEFQETGKFPSHISGEEGVRDMKILMAIYEAAATGKKVSLV